jgi:hypothetical protein
MTKAQAPATAKGGKAQQQAQMRTRAFRVGVQSHEENNYDVTVTMTGGTQDLAVFEPPPQGFLRGIYVLVEATGASNVATVAYQKIDAPWNIIDSITLEDTNSKPIVGPLGGYDLYLINKYGGYVFGTDPKRSPIYNATAGTTTPYAAAFALRIPVELVARDALGSLPNKSGTNKFRVRVRIAASTSVFSTAPTNLPSIRVRMTPENWWEPQAQDLKGRPLAQNPPALQTTQFWTKGVYNLSSGDQRVQVQQGLGYLIRNYIFTNRDTSSVRSSTTDGNFPDPLTLQFEANIIFDRLRALWQDRIYRLWGFNVAVGTSDVVATTGGGGREYSVYPLPFTDDFGLMPGAETRRGYLATSDGSRMEVRGNFGAASNFEVLANYVSPASLDDATITA